MSGAPVYVPDLGRVVGMVTGYWDSLKAGTGFADRDTALATPAEAIAALADVPLEKPATLFNVPDLPDHYIPREEDLARVREMLLRPEGEVVGIVGVRGMGGIGKSVLAAALARDPAVQDAFPDGVVWLPLGREPDLTARQEDLALALTGRRERFRDDVQGKALLRLLVEDKAALVVLDDVWDARHVEPFRVLGERSRLLITTRHQPVLDTFD
ncbi:MAG TPA: hypothetical protein ENK56_08620, partial [Chloroflexi bacterium]|nr:hypothetical protein [Chloroflexota bacterium]